MTPHLDCVLLVDDDPATNFLNRLTLEESGCVANIEEALSGDAAIDYLARCNASEAPVPQLVLCDINMPRVDGWQFAEQLAKSSIDPLPTLIMVTTSTNPNDRERAKALDIIADFIIKPLELDDFKSILEAHFSEPT